MGCALSAPLTAAASCLGSCAGSCCCAALSGGSVSSDRAARLLLVGLQAFAAILALLAAIDPLSWLSWPCARLSGWGVCTCVGDGIEDNSCLREQLMLRAEAAATAVFLILLILCIGGCTVAAARSYVVLKFFAVLLLAVVFMFVPNLVFRRFGAAASGISALFLVVQAVLVIDCAYTWNESWFSKALAARRGDAGSRGYLAWQVAILSAAGLALACAAAGAAGLFVALPQPATTWVLSLSLIVGIVELLFSVTTFCEHGALLTSSVVLAYAIWLAYQALALSPLTDVPGWMRWIELVVCVLTMLAFAQHAKLSVTATGAAAGAVDVEAAGTAGADAPVAPEGERPQVVGEAFAAHCIVHAAAALYITSALVPFQSWVTFGLRTAALAVALSAYGWSLLAPKVLTRRSFV